MAVLASILPVVSRSSVLALELFKTAAESPEAARELAGIANKINGFASILKQVGTIIKEDDRLPSPEAFDALDDVIEQSQNVLSSFESAASIEGIQHHDRRDSASSVGSTESRLDSSTKTRSEYLMAHLDALSTTLSVLLQTLYTAQSIIWSKLRPTVSPQQAARVVDNEKLQLETLIIQQQLSILLASDTFQNSPQSDSRLLMEDESSQSLIVKEQGQTPKPSSLYPYQNKTLFSLDTSVSNGLPSVCKISAAQAEHLLHRWTCLPQFERRLQEEEYEQRKQRQQAQQATVESDSEEEHSQNSKQSGDGVRRSRRSGSVQPLFAENNMPSPESEKQFGPRAPPTPADTPHTSQTNISTTSSDSSIGSPPVNAAAAVEAKEEDDEADLEIPWKLCTRKYYWRFIDAKQVSSNTDQPSSLAFAERNSWTEIMASWVCKEAIQEARLPFTQVQKERRDGRRTKFETCFCITKPLQFDQVNRLVERTVEMYRKNAPPTPPAQPKVRTSSFHRQPPPSINAQKGSTIDRSRTPVTRSTHPPLDRAKSSINLTPPGGPPPPLDRSMSTPGPGLVPPLPQAAVNSRTPSIQIPVPPGQQQYGQQFPPPPPHSPRHPYYPQQSSGYPSQPPHYYPPPPPYPTTTGSFPPPPPHPYLHASTSNLNLPNNHLHPMQASSRRSSHLNSHNSGYPARRHEDNDTTTSDSESERPRRSRRERDRSRAKYGDNRHGKKSHGGRKTAAAGALLGVGGLTALLDGLSGL